MTKRTYRVVPVSDMVAGDIVKITRRRVVEVERNAEGVTVTFDNGAKGGFFGTERHGIYR